MADDRPASAPGTGAEGKPAADDGAAGRWARSFVAKLILGVVAIGAFLVAAGVQGLHDAETERSPRTLTVAEFMRRRPDESWLRLTECAVDLREAVWVESSSKKRTAYLIARAAGEPSPKRAHLVICPDDEVVLQTLEDLRAFEEKRDEQGAREYFEANRGRIAFVREFEGLMRAEYGLSADDQDALKRRRDLFHGPAVLDEGERPSWLRSIALLAAGVVVGVAGVVLFVRRAECGL